MGYMSRLNNVFLVPILALICSILPSSAMMYIGFRADPLFTVMHLELKLRHYACSDPSDDNLFPEGSVVNRM